jgi:hypothetical protein
MGDKKESDKSKTEGNLEDSNIKKTDKSNKVFKKMKYVPKRDYRVAIKRIFLFRATLLGFYIGVFTGLALAQVGYFFMVMLMEIRDYYASALTVYGISLPTFSPDAIFNLSLGMWVFTALFFALLFFSIAISYNILAKLGAAQKFQLVEYELQEFNSLKSEIINKNNLKEDFNGKKSLEGKSPNNPIGLKKKIEKSETKK